MASRWRVWSGEAHVDSYPKEVEKERLVQDRLKYIPVDHCHSWEEFHQFIKNKTQSLSPYLNELVKKDKEVCSCTGLGRAEMLNCYIDRTPLIPGGLRQHVTVWALTKIRHFINVEELLSLILLCDTILGL